MALFLAAEEQQVLEKFRHSELDTGSSEVQISLLTFRIKKLTGHFKSNKQDYHSRQGLIRIVNRRRKLLDYLKNQNHSVYSELIKQLGIRK